MGDHSDIDHTGLTGVGGGTPDAHAASHQAGGSDPIKLDDLATPDDNTDLNASTTRHGLLRKLSNTATEYLDGTGAWSTPAGGGGGASFDQVYPYPSAFSGDSDDMTATTNWVDVDAFTAKTIDNGSVLHLRTVGPSKDDRVRFTLGTTKAGVFDFRFHRMMLGFQHWGANDDTYAEIVLSTSGGTIIAIARLQVRTVSGTILHFHRLVAGTTAVVTTNTEVPIYAGEEMSLRITRDAGNLLGFHYGKGAAPVAMRPLLKQADNTLYAPSSSGTVARVELSIHTPSGPGAAQHECDWWIDAFESL